MADSFFRRWSRRKTDARQDRLPAEPGAGADRPEPSQPPSAAAEQDGRPLPTLADVAALTPESDYSAFVACGVDPLVRRQALKKLFATPGFARIDGLDIHMEDYNRFEPMPAAMRAALDHAKSVLNPVPLYQTEAAPAQDPAATAADNGGMPQGSLPADPPQRTDADTDVGADTEADPGQA